MANIFVTGASSLIGYGILKSIRCTKKPYKLIGSTIYENSIVPAFTDVCIEAPFSGSEGYIDWFIKVIKDYNVDLIIPSIEEDVNFLADCRTQIESTGAKVALNNSGLIHLCNDKWLFFEKLKNFDCPYALPSSLSSDFDWLTDNFGLPLLLKPRRGSASKGIVRIFDEKVFLKHKDKIGKELMVQPLIGDRDEEFTISAFCDGNGDYFAIMMLKRVLSKWGYTEKAEVINNKSIAVAVKEICEIFKPFGTTNFQFREHKGKLYLLEINPRFSSANSIRTAFGYNDALMSIEYYLEGKIPDQPEIKQGKAVRYIEDYISLS